MSSAQITPEAQIGPVPAKSMAGKYDGRVKANKSRIKKPTGRKPEFAKHLTRNTAAVVLKEASAKELWLQLLGTTDARLQFEVLRYLTDRLEGKPFVAENPNSKAVTNNILNDNRLQIAIQQLVPPKQERKSKKTRAIQATSEAKQLEASNPITQVYVDQDPQPIDSTEEVSK